MFFNSRFLQFSLTLQHFNVSSITGIDVNVRDDNTDTPFIRSIRCGCVTVARALLNAGEKERVACQYIWSILNTQH